jgi:hypothetical protein
VVSFRFSDKILCAFLISWFAHNILLHLVTLIMFGEEYRGCTTPWCGTDEWRYSSRHSWPRHQTYSSQIRRNIRSQCCGEEKSPCLSLPVLNPGGSAPVHDFRIGASYKTQSKAVERFGKWNVPTAMTSASHAHQNRSKNTKTFYRYM